MFVKATGGMPVTKTIVYEMGMILKCLFVWITAVAGVFSLSAQELNVTVKVHAQALDGTHKQLFASLEEAMHTFIKGHRWSDFPNKPNEKIDCTFTLLITDALSAGSFRGELYVQSRKLTGISSRMTPMLNIRDKQFEFDYTAYLPLSFDLYAVRDNLTATIAFYVYLILGLDADSEALLGGTPFYRAMEQVAISARSYGWRGWESERSSRSRSVMANTFNEGYGEAFRKMWFRYHTWGRDRLSTAVEGGEDGVAVVTELALLHDEQPASVLIPLFGDAKLDELTQLLSTANVKEKQKAYQTLREIYPTRGAVLDKLR